MTDLSFLKQPSEKVAPQLLGYRLYKQMPNGQLVGGVINETEAYSEDDKASHCYGGKCTERTAPMFMPAGHIYVYHCRGYHCFNIVTGKNGRGEGVLIRSLIPDKGLDIIIKNRNNRDKLTSGPGMLGQALGITMKDRNKLLNNSDILLLPPILQPKIIEKTKRIGITKDTHRLWRFVGNF